MANLTKRLDRKKTVKGINVFDIIRFVKNDNNVVESMRLSEEFIDMLCKRYSNLDEKVIKSYCEISCFSIIDDGVFIDENGKVYVNDIEKVIYVYEECIDFVKRVIKVLNSLC